MKLTDEQMNIICAALDAARKLEEIALGAWDYIEMADDRQDLRKLVLGSLSEAVSKSRVATKALNGLRFEDGQPK